MMVFFSGMAMAASMIVAIGPQNALLIRCGLARVPMVFAVAGIFVAVDTVLIALGVLGVDALVAQVPALKLGLAGVAAAFFLYYGVSSLWRGCVGGLGSRYGDLATRLVFSSGAVAASFLWFATLAVTSFAAGRYLTGPLVWRVLDGALGVLMIGLAAKLTSDVTALAFGIVP